MKVKLTGHWGKHNPGDIVTVTEAQAEALVDGGALDEVKPARTAKSDDDNKPAS